MNEGTMDRLIDGGRDGYTYEKMDGWRKRLLNGIMSRFINEEKDQQHCQRMSLWKVELKEKQNSSKQFISL